MITQLRGKYTLKFKMEAVRLVREGQEAVVTAKVVSVPSQTMYTRIKSSAKGEPKEAADKLVSAGQTELARLRA
jgi:transposase